MLRVLLFALGCIAGAVTVISALAFSIALVIAVVYHSLRLMGVIHV